MNTDQQEGAANPKWRISLREFLKEIPTREREDFAKRCGTTKSYLELLRYDKSCNIELAVALHRESNGRVPMQEMYPDLDWDYIRSVISADGVQVDAGAIKQVLHDAIDKISVIPLTAAATGKARAKGASRS